MDNTPVGNTNNTNVPMITSHTLELMNTSSCSGEEFALESLSLPDLEDPFRVAFSSRSGSAGAAIFTRSNEMEADSEHYIDTGRSTIANDIMELLNGIFNVYPMTLIGSSEVEMEPFVGADYANVEKNSYVWQVQRVSPTARRSSETDRDKSPSNT